MSDQLRNYNRVSQDDQFGAAMLAACLFACANHFILIGLFFFQNVPELGWYNVFSTLCFGWLFFALKKKVWSARTVFIAASLEVVFHTVLATYFVGFESGFIFYVFAIVPLFLLNTNWKQLEFTFFFCVTFIVFIGTFFLFKDRLPVYEWSEYTLYLNRMFCVIGTMTVTVGIFIYFARILSRKNNEINETNRLLNEKNIEVEKQCSQQEVLLKEVHHRVKNNLQIISSLINLQKNRLTEERLINILEDSKSRITAMALIHQKLYQGEDLASVSFSIYLSDLLDSQKSMNPWISFYLDSIDLELGLDTAVPLGLISAELITNASKHAFESAGSNEIEVSLEICHKKGGYCLKIRDNGKGLPENFDFKSPNSLGMEIIHSLSEQIEATVFFNRLNEGTEFVVLFQTNDVPFFENKVESIAVS